jgi:ubiquinone/menaquinone biosynthesis C-methylase UbiE
MVKVNLLNSILKIKRNVNQRLKKTKDDIKISKKFGKDYFDGERKYGYGGYKYDGRWKPVAKRIVSHFNLKSGSKVLDIGCGKGFLVKDLLDIGIDAYGLDISSYALKNCEKGVSSKLYKGDAKKLNFSDNFFDAVVSINCIHNLKKKNCIKALMEIERVSKGKSFVQVDCYENEREKKSFLNWVLTAETYGYPNEWFEIFEKAKYRGDWFWTKV